MINMTAEPCAVEIKLPIENAVVVLSTHTRAAGEIDLAKLDLQPFEAVVVEIR
jgi:hypothetical protein